METRRRSRGGQVGIGVHTDDVVETQDRMLGPLPVHHRHLDTRRGHRVHVVEAGEGPPAVFLHGTNTSSLSFVPLLGHLDGFRMIAVDRPGRGLSDPDPVPRARFREAAVEFVDDVLDTFGIPAASLVGQSGGGVWALWHAIARPERVRSIVLLGSVPLLPGTRCPAPLRAMATPGLSAVLTRVLKPTRRSLVQLLSSVGESDTIVLYPDLIDALVAAGKDPVTRTADLAELRALIRPSGFRPSMRLRADELRTIDAPTLVIWGDHDPIGSAEVARDATELMPNARLEVVPTGHVPQLGHPQRVAAMVSSFLASRAAEA